MDLSDLGAILSEKTKPIREHNMKVSQMLDAVDDIRKTNEAIKEHSEKLTALNDDVEKIRQNSQELNDNLLTINEQISTLRKELAEERVRAEKAEKKSWMLAFSAGTISLLVSLFYPSIYDLLYRLGVWIAA